MVVVGIFSLVGDPQQWRPGGQAGRDHPPPGAVAPQEQPDDPHPEQGHRRDRSRRSASLLALWSLTGAMQNVMWGLNVAYERDDTRGFLRRRITALTMVVFAGARLPARLRVADPWPAPGPSGSGTPPEQKSLVDLAVVGRTVADPARRPARRLRWRSSTSAQRRASALAASSASAPSSASSSWLVALGRFRVLREPVRLLQQDLGLALGGRRHAHLALAEQPRAPLRRRNQRRGRTHTRTPPGEPAEVELQAPPKAA